MGYPQSMWQFQPMAWRQRIRSAHHCGGRSACRNAFHCCGKPWSDRSAWGERSPHRSAWGGRSACGGRSTCDGRNARGGRTACGGHSACAASEPQRMVGCPQPVVWPATMGCPQSMGWPQSMCMGWPKIMGWRQRPAWTQRMGWPQRSTWCAAGAKAHTGRGPASRMRVNVWSAIGGICRWDSEPYSGEVVVVGGRREGPRSHGDGCQVGPVCSSSRRESTSNYLFGDGRVMGKLRNAMHGTGDAPPPPPTFGPIR